MAYDQDEPYRLPVKPITIGNTWRLDFWLVDYNEATQVETAFDLTGVTGVAKIRREAAGAVLATPTVAITSASEGHVTATLTAAATALLVPEHELHLGVQLTWTNGDVFDVIEAPVPISRGMVT